MEEITLLRKLQLVELQILQEVKKICDENNITYYISGGTFLGAVRHKGFIPWDDDVDIAMPRKDYEKFRLIANSKLPSGYKYRNFKDDDEIRVCFSRVENSSIKLKDTISKKEEVRNAYIDIFPLDGMPNSKVKFIIRKYHLLFLKLMLKYSQFSTGVDMNLKDRKLHEKIFILIGRVIPFEKFLKTKNGC